MNNRKIFQLVLLLCMTGTAIAQQQVSLQEARLAAVNFTTERMGLRTPVEVDTVFVDRNSSEQPLLYEVVLANGEAVLLSASKACTPILGYGYSASGETILNHPNSLPEGLNDFLTSYRAQVADCLSNRNVALSYSGTWDSLQNIFTVPGIRNRNSVGPLLTTKWGQSYSNDSLDANAYNFYAPNSNGNCGTNNCKAGCAAVALGQVMKYYNHPVADTNDHTYDWCNMPDILYTTDEFYEQKRNAIASLLYDCAEATDMLWCMTQHCASLTAMDNISNALSRFRYGGVNKKRNTLLYFLCPSQWVELLKDALNSSWLIIYSSDGNTDYGHIFVCDGYDEHNLFHFNWGWGGRYNGYYNINNLNPGTYDFNDSHELYYVAPLYNQYIPYCHIDMNLGTYYESFYQHPDNFGLAPHKHVPKLYFNLTSADENDDFVWRNIPDGGISEYHAHKSIVLKSGFSADRGSEFWAHITPCPSCDRYTVDSWNCSDHKASEARNKPFNEEKDVVQETKMYVVSPNPVQNKLYIDSDIDIALGLIRIFDITGRESTTWNIDQIGGGHAVINTSNMQNGVYVIQITSPEGIAFSHKFVKQ